MSCTNCTDPTTTLAALPCPAPSPCPSRACTPHEYTCGGWKHKVDANGCWTRERLAGVLPDGTYQNPTLTIVDGCLAAIAAGTNLVQTRPEPCTTTSGSVVIPSITLSPAPGNLLSGTSSSLYAGVSWNQAAQNITITGSGTTTSPFVASYTGGTGVMSFSSTNLTVNNTAGAITANTSGANVNTCGIQITDGVVKTFVPPITSIVAGAGISVSTTACVATVSSTTQSKAVIIASCGTSFIDSATGTLPVNGSWDLAHVVVSGSRLFYQSPYPCVVYDSTGTAIGTAPNVTTFGSNALALAAMDTVYSMSGTSVC